MVLPEEAHCEGAHFKVTEVHRNRIERVTLTLLPGADDQYIKNLNFLSLLGYDIYMKKKIMERIIDEMAAEQAKEQEQTNGKERKFRFLMY